MALQLPDPARFRVETVFPVRWGDCDLLGHVNNARYFSYFEEARAAYFQRIAPGMRITPHSVGPILARTDCNFLLPIEYPATIAVATRTVRVGTSSLEVEHLVRDAEHRRVYALGSAVMVAYDYRTGRKVPVPDSWREGIRALDGD